MNKLNLQNVDDLSYDQVKDLIWAPAHDIYNDSLKRNPHLNIPVLEFGLSDPHVNDGLMNLCIAVTLLNARLETPYFYEKAVELAGSEIELLNDCMIVEVDPDSTFAKKNSLTNSIH